jgi:DNA-binding transcriptional regulator YiaG
MDNDNLPEMLSEIFVRLVAINNKLNAVESKVDKILDCPDVRRAHYDTIGSLFSVASSLSRRMARVEAETLGVKAPPPESCIKALREALGLSRDEFAQQFGIPVGDIVDWERGRGEPSQIARAYLRAIANDPLAVQRAQLIRPEQESSE